MSVIARFEVIPVRDGSMSTAIASALRALDEQPVTYRTTATDTIIEADSVEQVFAAVRAAHEAIPDDRVITSVEVDEDRRRPQSIDDRVASVERELGHPARHRGQPAQSGGQSGQPPGQPGLLQSEQPQGGRPTGQLQSGPVRAGHAPPQRMESGQARPIGKSPPDRAPSPGPSPRTNR